MYSIVCVLAASCPEGWSTPTAQAVPYCYKFVSDRQLNVDDARAYCRSSETSADLVSAERRDERVRV